MRRLMNGLLIVLKYELRRAVHLYWWPTALADARRERDEWKRWCEVAEERNRAVLEVVQGMDGDMAQASERTS